MLGIMKYLDCGCGLIRGGGLSPCPAHQTDAAPAPQARRPEARFGIPGGRTERAA